eukprot:GHVN01074330.1.p1 GENE.GHVN01074330.1~~GHVN01074330.1.p1  ORF type:complete len:178 (+),score=16.25 GHVN01074330.1:120-653(+)
MRVFLLDSSKQAGGAMNIHTMNMICASVLAKYFLEDPCHLYWTNIMIDTTLGVWISFVILKRLKGLVGGQEFGDYGMPPNLKVWGLQFMLWQVVVMLMKLCVAVIMLVGHRLFRCIARFALQWTEGNPKTELVFVMIVTPTLMSTFQYWMTDNFIKFQAKGRLTETPHELHGQHDEE